MVDALCQEVFGPAADIDTVLVAFLEGALSGDVCHVDATEVTEACRVVLRRALGVHRPTADQLAACRRWACGSLPELISNVSPAVHNDSRRVVRLVDEVSEAAGEDNMLLVVADEMHYHPAGGLTGPQTSVLAVASTSRRLWALTVKSANTTFIWTSLDGVVHGPEQLLSLGEQVGAMDFDRTCDALAVRWPNLIILLDGHPAHGSRESGNARGGDYVPPFTHRQRQTTEDSAVWLAFGPRRQEGGRNPWHALDAGVFRRLRQTCSKSTTGGQHEAVLAAWTDTVVADDELWASSWQAAGLLDMFNER
jgi:hypothetical protein